MNLTAPNQELRTYVQSTEFYLSLKKTHIQMLIAVAQNDRSNGIRDWVSPGIGLKRRGLAFHSMDIYGRSTSGPQKTFSEDEGREPYPSPLNTYYRLTRAGWAVYDLLVEAGMAKPIPLEKRAYCPEAKLYTGRKKKAA